MHRALRENSLSLIFIIIDFKLCKKRYLIWLEWSSEEKLFVTSNKVFIMWLNDYANYRHIELFTDSRVSIFQFVRDLPSIIPGWMNSQTTFTVQRKRFSSSNISVDVLLLPNNVRNFSTKGNVWSSERWRMAESIRIVRIESYSFSH